MKNVVYKDKIFYMLKNTDFNSANDVKQLCVWFNTLDKNAGSDSFIKQLYHIR